MLRSRFPAAFSILVAACAFAAPSPDAAALFEKNCATCHRAASDTRAPLSSALALLPRQAIIAALETGTMKAQGAALTSLERNAVVDFLVAKQPALFTTSTENLCATVTPLTTLDGWNGWGVDLANTRLQPAKLAGLTADQVPGLMLKWAFGFPGASSAFGQPTVAGGRLFLGSQDGTVYSLDAHTGCTYWKFKAPVTVRSAVSLAADENGAYLAYFGDLGANVYAVNAQTGALVWKTKVDDHRFARITGSPKFYRNRLYVPVSSVEEVAPGSAKYPCCTFRGSVVALDARNGKQIWKTYSIPDPPTSTGKSAAEVERFGPAGAAIWSSPTLDPQRGVLYAGTGNSYSDPPVPTSDAILAIEMETGSMLWSRQLTPADGWNFSCINPDKSNCPGNRGEDWDIGASPILRTLSDGRSMLLVGQKSGFVHALDPDQKGKIVWQTRIGKGSALGGVMWGFAADMDNVYVPLSDYSSGKPAQGGGMFALRAATGEKVWNTSAPKPACIGKGGCSASQMAPASLIPGVVFSGSMDGHLRAYQVAGGAIIWDYDTLQEYSTVNGVKAHGGSLSASGPTIVGGMLYVNSGYGALAGMGGNVLLAFSINGK